MGITTFSRHTSSKWGGPSDFSRPSIASTIEPEPKKAEISSLSQPRFSVFGKKAKFEIINQKALEQDTKTIRKNKFEIHHKKKSKKSVAFDPVFLERVCLFRESQTPIELKEAHDNPVPAIRIICPNWPSKDSNESNILINKKSFSLTPDHTQIKGKIGIRNLALDKSVSIRYTLDAWTTVSDVDAVFFGPNPKNVAFDIYEFAIDLGPDQLADRGEVRAKIEFTIRFTAGDTDYWDNNQGSNYKIKVICDPLNDPWAEEKKLENQQDRQENDDDDDDDDYFEEEEEEEEEEKHNSFTNALKGYKHAKPFHLNKRQPWLGTRYDFAQSLSLAKRAPYESWSNSVKPDPDLITDYFLVKPITIKPTTPLNNTPTPSSSATTTKLAPNIISFSSYPKLSSTTSTPTVTEQISTPSKPLYTSSSSAPPSPRSSPKLSAPPRPVFYNQSLSTSSILPMASSTSSPLDMNSSYYLDLVNKYCFYHSESNINDSISST